MKKTDTEPIGNVIYQFLRDAGLEMPLNEFRLVQAWNEVMGKTVSRYTTDLKIYNQVLYVTISSAPLRNEILMRRTALVQTLNDHVGAQVIRSITVK